MNEVGLNLLWLAAQVTLLCTVALLVLAVTGRRPGIHLNTSWLSIVFVLALTLLSFSPWPRWSWESLVITDAGTTAVSVDPRNVSDASPRQQQQSAQGTAVSPPRQDSAWAAAIQTFTQDFGKTPASPSDAPSGSVVRWSGWIAYLVLACLVTGLLRFAIGWLAVRQMVRKSLPVSDPQAIELLDVLRAQLNCTRKIRLCSSSNIPAPATTGCLRHVILLPADWTKWSRAELKAVLAHEIAHVVHHDAGKWLVAQISLLVNFYHPLVHVLVRRLRLEQELAADKLAAPAAGGSRAYLTKLAELAVSLPSEPQAWPAQAFFPPSGTLLRRIEMLRDHSVSGRHSLWRFPCIALLMVVAVTAAGLRRPARAADPAVAAPTPSTGAAIVQDTSYPTALIPPNAALIVGMQPAALTAVASLESLTEAIQQEFREADLQLQIADIQSLMLVCLTEPSDYGPGISPPILILRAASDANVPGISAALETTNKVVSRNNIPGGAASVAVPLSDRSFVIGPANDVRKFLDNNDGTQPSWVAALGRAPGQLHFAADPAPLRPSLQRDMSRGDNPFALMMAPLWLEPVLISGNLHFTDSMALQVTALTTSPDAAGKVKTAVDGMLPVFRALLSRYSTHLSQNPGSASDKDITLMGQAGDLLMAALATTTVTTDDTSVTMNLSAYAPSLAKLMMTAVPAVRSARAAALRTQDTNNIRQLLIALHNYDDVHGHFPPPYLVGPDRKTKYSWRVAILPYIEQKALYDMYRFDEPWDSEANKKVLQQMPHVFASAASPPDSIHSAYFGLVGRNTAMGDGPDED